MDAWRIEAYGSVDCAFRRRIPFLSEITLFPFTFIYTSIHTHQDPVYTPLQVN